MSRKLLLCHPELVKLNNKLKHPQINVPRALPIALITGITAKVPLNDMEEQVRR